MKSRNLAKIVTLILSCALLIGAAVGIAVSAEETAPSVTIAGANIAYEGAVQVVYYVDAQNIAETDVVKLVITDAEGNEQKTKTNYVDFVREGVTYKAFFSDGIAPKNLRQNVYAKAIVVNAEGAVVAESAVKEYSPYTYAMNRFAQSTTAAQTELYKALLNYGAAVQAVLDPNAGTEGYEWADEYYFVTLDGEAKSYRGNEFDGVLTADRFNEAGQSLTGWTDGEGEAVRGWLTYTVKPGYTTLNRNYADTRADMVTYDEATAQVVTNIKGNAFAEYTDGVLHFGKVDEQVNGSYVKVNAATPGVFATTYVYETDFKIESMQLTKGGWVYKFCIWGVDGYEVTNIVANYVNEKQFSMGNAVLNYGEWHHLKMTFTFKADGTADFSTYVDGAFANIPGAQIGYTNGKYALTTVGVQMRDSSAHDCMTASMYLDNTVCYAEGPAVTTEITLDANNGEEATTYTATAGAAYTLPTPTNPTGAKFLGWYNAKDELVAQTGTWYYAGTAPTYTAKWSEVVTVNFNANGGTCDTTTMTIVAGEAYELPTATRSGLIFGGWFDENGTYYAPEGTWPVESESEYTLTATWYITVDSTSNDFATDGKYTNASVTNDQVAGDGKVTIKPADWNTNTWFSIGGEKKVYTGNAAGSKYVFEAEFTYEGGIAPVTDSSGAGFIGFTNTVSNSNEHMYYNGNVLTSKTTDESGDAEYVTIFGATYYKGVTYQVRYEQIVGTNLMVVYTNGEFSHVFNLLKMNDAKIEANKLDPTNVCKFMYVWRTAGKGITVTLDNTYVALEAVAAQSSFTLDANGGILPENTQLDYTLLTGENYTLPTPTSSSAALVFAGWYCGDTMIAPSGKWSAALGTGATVVAQWKYIVTSNTNDFNDKTIVNGGTNGGSYSDGALVAAPGAWVETYFSFGKAGQFNGPFTNGTKYVVEMDFTYNGGGNVDNLAFVGIVTSTDASIKRDNAHMYSFSTMPADANGVTLFGQKYLTGVTYTVRYEFTVGSKTVDVYTNGVYAASITATVGKDDGNANALVESFAFYWRGKGKPSFTFDNVYTAIIAEPVDTNVTLDANGGYIPADVATTLNLSTGANYTLPTPNAGSFVFAGWYYGDALVANSGAWSITEETVALKAKWLDVTTTTFADVVTTGTKEVAYRNTDTAPLAAGDKVVFTTTYTYLGLTSFNVSGDGTVTAQGTSSTNYGFARFYDGVTGSFVGAFGGNGTVKPSGNYVNAEGKVVVDANGKLLSDYAELTAEEIFFEKLTWDGMVFEFGKTYTVVYTFVINGDGSITATPTATDADSNVKTGSAVKWNSNVNNITRFYFEYRSAKNAGVTSFKLTQSFVGSKFEIVKPVNGTLTTTPVADKTGNRVDPNFTVPNYDKTQVDEAGSKIIVNTTYKFDGIGGVFAIDENGKVSSYLNNSAVVAYIGFYNNGSIGDRVRYCSAKLPSTAKIVNAEGTVVVDANNVLLDKYADLTAADLYWSQINWGGITFEMGVEYDLTLTYTTAAPTVDGENVTYNAGTVTIIAVAEDGTVKTGKMSDGPAGDCDFVYNVQGLSFYFRGDHLVLGYATDAEGNKLVNEEGKNYAVAIYNCNWSFTNSTVTVYIPAK